MKEDTVTRIFISIAIICALLMMTPFTTFAAVTAGTENWGNSTSTYVGSMHLTNNTLSPVKTITKSGTLHIVGNFTGEDIDADTSPIKLTAQVRKTSGEILTSTTEYDTRNGLVQFSMSCSVTNGDQLRIFFDASSISNPPGYYRKAYVEYWYYIS